MYRFITTVSAFLIGGAHTLQLCNKTIQAAEEVVDGWQDNIEETLAEQDKLIKDLFDKKKDRSIKRFEYKLRKDYEVALEKGEVPLIAIKVFFPGVAEGESESCAENKRVTSLWDQIGPLSDEYVDNINFNTYLVIRAENA